MGDAGVRERAFLRNGSTELLDAVRRLIRAATDEHHMRCGCRGENCEVGEAIAAYERTFVNEHPPGERRCNW